jgi:NAD(P)-dependent dehydrogenase (short-subunit alcohol dehydrogenase family)
MAGILAGKVAIVTGAGRGIGRAIALEYAAEGAKVSVASRTAKSVNEVVNTIRANNGEALALTCDVGDKAAIEDMIARTVAAYGGIDILVNNAQGFGTRANPQPKNNVTPLEEYSDEEWDWVFNTGFKGTYYAMKSAFPYLKASRGSVINFGSHRGIISTPFTGAYNVTKEAIRSLSRTAANEWGQYGIRVNVINPIIETDAYREDLPTAQLRQQFEQTIPLRHIGQPTEAARAAVFLAGPDSRYITGSMLTVDGGVTSRP